MPSGARSVSSMPKIIDTICCSESRATSFAGAPLSLELNVAPMTGYTPAGELAPALPST